MWFLQFFFYGMGESKLGNGASSWILHMSFIILVANIWGLILKEWKNVSNKTSRTIIAGILTIILSILIVLFVGLTALHAADSEEGFTPIFDGKTFDGWQKSTDNTNTWQLEEGAFVARGPTAHLFYTGDPKPFKNFELKVDVMTVTNSNGGIYFHTAYQEKGFPRAGIECQVNVSHSDWIKTGSLYGLVNIGLTPAHAP